MERQRHRLRHALFAIGIALAILGGLTNFAYLAPESWLSHTLAPRYTPGIAGHRSLVQKSLLPARPRPDAVHVAYAPRSRCFWTVLEAVIGSSSRARKQACSGTLKSARASRQDSRRSSSTPGSASNARPGSPCRQRHDRTRVDRTGGRWAPRPAIRWARTPPPIR